MTDSTSRPGLDYAAAGVDVKAGEQAVDRIKALAKSTFTPNVLSEIGSFGGFFKPLFGAIQSPVMISSADGVGTKLKLAFMTDKHDTVGEDLVNHCINDILVHGAKPLFFLDYIATGKLNPETVEQIVDGLARGCRNGGMALLGGETAEMPDFYQPGEYDLAGFIVGVVDEKKIVNGSTIVEGDTCIGITSNGLHTNGYTLARKVLFDIASLDVDDPVEGCDLSIAEALMQVHTCYLNPISKLLDRYEIHGMAHITGGGIGGNLKRIIPDNLSAEIDTSSWEKLPVFEFIKEKGNISSKAMFEAFNMGIGYIIVVGDSQADKVCKELSESGSNAYRIGTISSGDKKVRLLSL